jgi:hypothetical protein
MLFFFTSKCFIVEKKMYAICGGKLIAEHGQSGLKTHCGPAARQTRKKGSHAGRIFGTFANNF